MGKTTAFKKVPRRISSKMYLKQQKKLLRNWKSKQCLWVSDCFPSKRKERQLKISNSTINKYTGKSPFVVDAN